MWIKLTSFASKIFKAVANAPARTKQIKDHGLILTSPIHLQGQNRLRSCDCRYHHRQRAFKVLDKRNLDQVHILASPTRRACKAKAGTAAHLNLFKTELLEDTSSDNAPSAFSLQFRGKIDVNHVAAHYIVSGKHLWHSGENKIRRRII